MRNQKLDAVIQAILGRARSCTLNKTQLIKLVFLCDYEHYQTFGETITGLTYRCLEMGPVAWEIPDQAATLSGVTHSYRPPSPFVYPQHTYVLERQPTASRLAKPETATIARVVKRWGGKTAGALVRVVHAEPFSEVLTEGSPVDFSILGDDPLDSQAAQDVVWAAVDTREAVGRATKEGRQREGHTPAA